MRLTTLTRDFFMPRFLERDEAEREPPCELYPWDGVRNVRPFSQLPGVGGRRGLLTCATSRCSGAAVPTAALDVVRVPHYRTRETVAEVSQANAGLVARDLRPASQAEMQAPLARHDRARTCSLLSARAARHLVEDTLPLGDEAQTPDDYVRQTSSTTGMPHVMVRRNLEKIRGVLANMGEVLAGLTRGLDLRVLDDGMNTAGPALSLRAARPHAGRRAAQQLARACMRCGCRRSRSRPRSC